MSKKAGSLNIWDVLVQHFMPTTEDIANWEMLAIYGLHLVSPQVPHGVWVSGTDMYMILTNTFLAMYAASEMLNSARFHDKMMVAMRHSRIFSILDENHPQQNRILQSNSWWLK